MLADFFYTLRDTGLAIYAEPVEGFPPHHYAQKHPLPPGPGDVLYVTRAAAGPACPPRRRPARGRPLAPGAASSPARSSPSACRGAAGSPGLTATRLAPMALHVRHPILILSAQPGAWTFSLFFLESVARASLVTVLPLTAYALFGSKEAVSLAYTLVSLAALGFTFAIPMLVRRLSRRWAYTLGAALLGLYAVLLALDAPPALVVAMFCRTAGAAMLNVTLSLYIMDNIGKRELTRSEPLRLAISTLAWGVAPYVGVRLMQSVGPLGAGGPQPRRHPPSSLAVFWALRLAEGGPIRAGAARPAPISHPLAAIRRFAAQPRLRLAWAIAFARSAFWTTFFIYVPILMVEGGLGATAGGLAVAAGNLMLLNNLFARALGRAPLAAPRARRRLPRRRDADPRRRPPQPAPSGGRRRRHGRRRLLRRAPRRPRPGALPARGPRPRARADDRGLPHLPRRLRAPAAARLLLPLHARRLRRRLRRASRCSSPPSAP